MNKADQYYIQNLKKILEENNKDENPRPKYKDGTPAHCYFISQVFEEYDMNKGEFPIPTLRNTAIKTGINEILWIYQDQDNSLESAHKRNIFWWDDWNVGDGTIGKRYGYTVGKYKLIDNLLNNLQKDPFSRRHIMNMFQEEDLNSSKGLYPCAYETIWSVRKINDVMYLDMALIQRSNDYITAGAINKIQYVALQMMVASHLNFKIGRFCHYTHNLHIYDRHLEAANELLSKETLDLNPYIELIGNKSFYDITLDDFKIHNIKGISKINATLELAI